LQPGFLSSACPVIPPPIKEPPETLK
jgi:hypothetical protein